MQTFVPDSDIARCAAVLDGQRLGKQRVETLQILHALHQPGYGWQHHPAVAMWRGYTMALVQYGVAMCNEWLRRGYRDTCLDRICAYIDGVYYGEAPHPPWWGGPIHENHRRALIAKDPATYTQYWPDLSPLPRDARGSLAYLWPTKGELNDHR